jgi:hypothetical protein
MSLSAGGLDFERFENRFQAAFGDISGLYTTLRVAISPGDVQKKKECKRGRGTPSVSPPRLVLTFFPRLVLTFFPPGFKKKR